ncbi:distal tail protein Dit [Helcococcus kunzii]|uniref:distal tail protein Dit n=1 Tax=Helcococcus kunzii TaxID=40091 RepID=UPI0038A02977
MDYTKYCAITFNGNLLDKLIPGYVTTNVDGRDLFVKNVESIIIPGRDGEYIISTRYPAKNIKVDFAILGQNNKDKRKNLLMLNNYLYSENEIEFSFSDEEGVRYGIVIETENPDYKYFQGEGSYIIKCHDPFLYSDIKNSNKKIESRYPHDVKIEKIELTIAKQTGKLIIKNITRGTKIILNGSFSVGDNVIIQKNMITKNNQNIMNYLDYIESDDQEFKAFNNDEIICNESNDVKIEYRERIS